MGSHTRKINHNLDLLSAQDRFFIEDYKQLLALNFNPFPATPVSWEEDFFSPLNENVKRELEEFVNRTYYMRQFGGLVIYGDYGSGKSHLIKYLQSQINYQLGGAGSEKSIALLINNPPASTQNIVFELFRIIGRSRLTKFLWFLFFQRAIDSGNLHQIENSDAFTEELDGTVNFRVFLDSVQNKKSLEQDIKNFSETVITILFDSPQFTQELSSIMLVNNEVESLRSWKILSGESLDESFKLAKKCPPEKQFAGLIRLLNRVGYDHIYILIDEFSDISLTHESFFLERTYLIDLDGIICDNLDYLSLVIALPEKAWMRLKQLSPSFAKHFDSNIRLLPLTVTEARNLILGYLNKARSQKSNSLRPFTTSAVEILNINAKGNIRKLIYFCNKAINRCIDLRLDSIDTKFAKDLVHEGENYD